MLIYDQDFGIFIKHNPQKIKVEDKEDVSKLIKYESLLDEARTLAQNWNINKKYSHIVQDIDIQQPSVEEILDWMMGHLLLII